MFFETLRMSSQSQSALLPLSQTCGSNLGTSEQMYIPVEYHFDAPSAARSEASISTNTRTLGLPNIVYAVTLPVDW